MSRILCISLGVLLLAAPLGAVSAKGKAAKTARAQKGKGQKGPVVELKTSMGAIRLLLNPKRAPITVANFLAYVKAGFYRNTIFHRVIPNFMIQGGGMTADMQEKTTRAPIKNEADNGLKNTLGTVAMARTSQPHSASAQFFINVGRNTFLNHRGKTQQGWGYAVFGRVIAGMEVVNKIRRVKTGRSGPHSNVPVKPIMILDAKLMP